MKTVAFVSMLGYCSACAAAVIGDVLWPLPVAAVFLVVSLTLAQRAAYRPS